MSNGNKIRLPPQSTKNIINKSRNLNTRADSFISDGASKLNTT